VTYRTDGLTALGDPTRRAIFEQLADRPRAVGELARELPVSRPAVSQHLKVLKDAGLVSDRAAGTRRI
jgi:DNA-binding transcriptional ArsR family regulator